MTDLAGENDKNSFSLTKESSRNPLTWQEHAYKRLKVLYGISKLLGSGEFEEGVFPKILGLCSSILPFVTGILIEKRGQSVSTSIWHTDHPQEKQVEKAISNAKANFAYLTGGSRNIHSEFNSKGEKSSGLKGHSGDKPGSKNPNEKYLVFPLVVDRLPAFGVLQIEAGGELDENDLEFGDALANLIAVAVDRSYKTKIEKEVGKAATNALYMDLSRSQTKVTNLEVEKGQRENFVSLLTHDLRTPLAAAKITAQMIQHIEETSEKVNSELNRIIKNIDRADQMITDLLDANRIRGGERLPLNLERFNLFELIRQTVEELGLIHGPRFVFKGERPLEGFWDKKGVRRILENLCNNAVKYGRPGSPINIILDRVGERVRIEVQNFGEVISPEDQKSLFFQFKRGRAQSGSKRGWGIGLTLVLGTAEAHNGTIKVKSDSESGTTFTVDLPMNLKPSL